MAKVTLPRPPIGTLLIAAYASFNACVRHLQSNLINITSQSRALLAENSLIFHVFYDIHYSSPFFRHFPHKTRAVVPSLSIDLIVVAGITFGPPFSIFLLFEEAMPLDSLGIPFLLSGVTLWSPVQEI